MEEIAVNKYQTPITEELFEGLPNEIKEQFFDYVGTIPFIKSLISPNREYAKDRPRDDRGRIIVDLAHPHILEDMDYFREAAIYYKEYGCYTKLTPNKNPNSTYMKWLRRERDRCWDGMVRPSDGEWITGAMYFYINYCPIMVIKQAKDKNGKRLKKAPRVEDFPEVWEGVYWRFHYLEQAKEGGLYNRFEGGMHAAELARRGCGKSFSLAGLMAKNLNLGDTRESHTRGTTILTAYTKEYLADKDGTLSKFTPMLNHIRAKSPLHVNLLKNSAGEMTWQAGYKNKDGSVNINSSLNTVIGVSSKDDEKKLRGKRGWILFEEFGSFPKLLDIYNNVKYSVEQDGIAFATIYLVGCVCAGTKVWTHNGRYINIEELQQSDGIIGYSTDISKTGNVNTICSGITKEPICKIIEPAKKECIRIELTNGNFIECSTDHPIYCQERVMKWVKLDKKLTGRRGTNINGFTYKFKTAKDIKVGDRICECREINIFGNDSLFDARLVGMLIGDGSYGFNNTPKYSSQDKSLLDYVESKYETSLSASHITKNGLLYKEIRIKNICGELQKISIYGQTKTKKRLPANYQTLNRQDTILLLSGLYDTDGCVVFQGLNSSINITQSTREILEQIQILWRKFGVIGSIVKTKPKLNCGRKDKNSWFTLVVSGRHNICRAHNILQLLVEYKNDNLKKCYQWYIDNPSKKACKYSSDLLIHTVKNVENIGEQTIYNLSAGLSHTYLSNNIITHNTAGDDASDFAGAKELIYNSQGYDIYTLPNVWDKIGQSKQESCFFYPAYINRLGYYNKDGVTDVVMSILDVLKLRYKKKHETSDPSTILKVVAEMPMTPAEAIIKAGTNMFPVADLMNRLGQLEGSGELDEIYTGDLVFDSKGEITFTPTAAKPIRIYPIEGNKDEGCMEIIKHPEKDATGAVYSNRYIAGIDPYDDDSSNTQSLGSIFVLDLWTDKIVCEYTGRPKYADDFFEKCRRILLYYNAKANYENNKKGLFNYFRQHNCLYLLTEILEFLKDSDPVKAATTYGNKKYGTNATLPINQYGKDLLNQWLRMPVTIHTEDEQEITTPALYQIKNKAFLLELISHNPVGNFDRISSMGMLMLLRADILALYSGEVTKTETAENDPNYGGNDDFFTRNYNKKLKSSWKCT